MNDTTVVQSDAFAGTVHQRPRPARYDKDICRAAAEALMPEFERWLGSEMAAAERERLVDLLASRCGENGYAIARDLERDGYDPDADLVEILDCFNTYSVYAKAVQVWLAETGANPRLAVGAVVSIPVRMKEHEGVVGEIVGIDRKQGEYTIYCAALGHVREGLGTRGLIFPWEEVESVNAIAEGSF